jgi:hypothetical protein
MASSLADALSLASQLLFTPEAPQYDLSFRHPSRELRFIPWDPPIPCMVHAASGNSTLFVVHFHGTAGDIERSSAWWKLVKEFPEADCNIIAVEFPGYGLFKGYASESSVVAAGCTAVRYLTSVCHVPLDCIVLSGRSMGGGVACAVAQQFPGVGGLIVGSTFTSLGAVVRQKSLLFYSIMRKRFDNLAVMEKVVDPSCNVLVFHGAMDGLIPVAQGEELFAKCRSLSKRFYCDPAGTHPKTEASEAIAAFILQQQRLCEQSRQAVELSKRVFSSFLLPGDAHLAAVAGGGKASAGLRSYSSCASVGLAGVALWWLAPTWRLETSFAVVLTQLALFPARDNRELRVAKYGLALILCQILLPILAVVKARQAGGGRLYLSAVAMAAAAHLVLR